jgi:hypothetical protein
MDVPPNPQETREIVCAIALLLLRLRRSLKSLLVNSTLLSRSFGNKALHKLFILKINELIETFITSFFFFFSFLNHLFNQSFSLC